MENMILLASIIKLDFKPKMQTLSKDTDAIQISDVDVPSKYLALSDEEQYKSFVNKYNDSFKLSIMYSLFSGMLSTKVEMTKLDSEPIYTDYKVEFIYGEEHTLYNNNEAVTKSDNSSNLVTYNRITFSLQEGTGLSNVYVYYYKEGTSLYYRFKTKANLDALYDFVSNISTFKNA